MIFPGRLNGSVGRVLPILTFTNFALPGINKSSRVSYACSAGLAGI